MERKQEIIQYLQKNKDSPISLIEPMIDNFVYLEEQLTKLREYPFLKVHPTNPELQKATPASKQYKELLQQYINTLKVLQTYDNNVDDSEESPLRKWVKSHVDNSR